MSAPAPASAAAEAVLTFLESVGRRSEAEFYLRLFLKLPPESFGIIAPGEALHWTVRWYARKLPSPAVVGSADLVAYVQNQIK